MSITALSNQLRLALEDPADKFSREQVLNAVDEFVVACVSSEEPEVQLFRVEEELQIVYNDVVDHTSLGHTEVFLGVLHHLRPLLSSTSIISTWFDLVLRPALREPRLPTTSVTHAKELIILAAENEDRRHPEKVHEFRRRLMVHLLDAYNEGSGDDILEWAKLDQKQRDKRCLWKCNLEDALIKFGLNCPVPFMTQVEAAFAAPSSRLQLLVLLDSFTSHPEFQLHATDLARHPLMNSLLNSLLLDNSSTICTIGLTMLVKLLPTFAFKACEELKILLPRLFVILARVICWEELSNSALPSTVLADDYGGQIGAGRRAEEYGGLVALELRPELGWERLELRRNTSSAPPSDAYFSSLYYLFPCNLLRFVRGPAAYLRDRDYESPYVVGWEDALDEDNIRSKSEPLLRSRVVNPRLIWRDWLKELTEPDPWANSSISQIASECVMLNIRNIALGSSTERTDTTPDLQTVVLPSIVMTPEDISGVPTPHPGYIGLPPVKTRVSLQDMITTSVALKSNLEVEVEFPDLLRSALSFPPGNCSPSKASIKLPSELVGDEGAQLPSHVAEAISSLQREVLLLRSELNFELWHSRENVGHIGRLYQDHVLSKNAEADRQALHNKLRQYKAQVQSLEQELKEHKEQSSSAKNKYADWNTELQKKLREYREEKKAWVLEAATLRTAEKEARALFVAQGKLLADAAKAVFELQTQQKENQHKIDRLHDYERQIEQHVLMQKLWDADFQKFNARGEEIELIKSKYKQMEMLLESHDKARDKLEDEARAHRRQNQALEARLALVQRRCEASRRIPEAEIAAIVREKSELAAANARLREDNAELKDEMDEMRAALEGLKAQLSRQRGLIYEPRQRMDTTVAL
ncbi:hypothetical protein HD554DRAFT_2016692 [Boletus coccyginus]|nr:hypothetical protein HD554DRAFT_2016692 [Boletus coccyginus]